MRCRTCRCHWYENVIGLSPTQVPVVVCRLTPTWAEPLITGGLVLTGCGAAREARRAQNPSHHPRAKRQPIAGS
jgi:hypothetical protein